MDIRQGVNGLFLTTTPIRCGGNEHATGFFLVYEGRPFLVTNNHVVDRLTLNGTPLKEVRIIVRPDPKDVTVTETISVRLLSQDGTRNWFVHPDSTIDLAVIPLKQPVISNEIEITSLNQDQKYNSGSLGFPASERDSHIFTLHEEIPAGTLAVTLGYPLFVPENKFPIARNTLIASPYGQNFEDMPAFATDCQTHQGLSGSPIISLNRGDSRIFDVGEVTVEAAINTISTIQWSMIGIHSGKADVTKPLDLGIGWYSELLYDIIEPHA